LSGPVNRSFLIEYVDSLNASNNWTPLATVFANQSPVSFSDTNGVKHFYRAVLLP
jgi:hypothetical protein